MKVNISGHTSTAKAVVATEALINETVGSCCVLAEVPLFASAGAMVYGGEQSVAGVVSTPRLSYITYPPVELNRY